MGLYVLVKVNPHMNEIPEAALYAQSKNEAWIKLWKEHDNLYEDYCKNIGIEPNEPTDEHIQNILTKSSVINGYGYIVQEVFK